MDLNGLAPVRKLDIGLLRQTLNSDNVNSDDSQINNKSIEHLPQIFRLLASLEDDTQKMLLDSWAKLEMPLNQKTINQLLEYLKDKTITDTEDKRALIKAFAFLKNYGFPHSKKLIAALKTIFNNNGDLANKLEKYIAAANKNEIALNLNSENSKIAEKLSNFSKITDQIISLLNKNGGENEKEILNNFLGQKLINLQNQELNSPLMLALEIPVHLKENKLTSLFLKIEKDDTAEKNAEKHNSGYNISFILEFENLGAVKSKININGSNIKFLFFTEKTKTANLIKNNISKLQSTLNNKDFKIKRIKIKSFDNFEEEKNEFFNKIILPELNNIDLEGKYRHIDIKI